MKFEHSEFLFGFLLLLIPIIIHLFNFRKHKIFYFSSIQFLKNIQEESKSVKKIKDILVLSARILAFSCLILAFAQPYLPLKNEPNNKLPSITAIYIDNSFSMSQLGTDGQLLSEAKEQARKFILQSTNNTKFLLVSNELSGIERKIFNQKDALQRLDKIILSPQSHPISRIVNWMKESVSSISYGEKYPPLKIVLLSDFQKKQTNFNELNKDNYNHYYPIQFVPEETSNISIDSIWFTDPNFKIKQNNELTIQLTNHGKDEVKNKELTLDINGSKRTVFFEIPSKSSKNITINYADYQTGLKSGALHINDNHLKFDDDYYFTYEVFNKANILIINGEQQNANISKTYGLDNYYHVSEISATSFVADQLTDKQLVVLNGINSFSDGMIEALVEFTVQHGSLIFFPGTNIEYNTVNKLMSELNTGSFSILKTSQFSIQNITYEDPFFKGIFEKKPEKLNVPLIKKNYRFTPNNTTATLISLNNNEPLLIKNKTSIVYTSCLDSTFSNLISNALFPSILLRTAEISQKRNPLSLTIGTHEAFPVYTPTPKDIPFRLSNSSIEITPTVERKNQINYVSLSGIQSSRLQKQGVYDLKCADFITKIALNLNRTESNLEVLSQSEISKQLTSSEIVHQHIDSIENGIESKQLDLEKPKEYWRIFIILALLFFVAEMVIIKFMR